MKKIYACMFGALLAVMPVPAAVAYADNTDAEFISYLEGHGIHLGSAAQTVKIAQTMCQDLDGGYSQADEVEQLTGGQRLSQDQAEIFIGAATADYCPGKHAPTRPGG